MRKGLIVGINYYEHMNQLYGCVNDAIAVDKVLKRNSDGTVNFSSVLLTADNSQNKILRKILRNQIKELFSGQCETALFYFAGHGHIESTGGYLISSDNPSGSDGLPLSEVLSFANDSPALNKIIVLDSCHSGIVGAMQSSSAFAEIKEGTTILTASTAEQYATEDNGSGVFTNLFVDGLNGAAANLVGDITPGSLYAHIDQSLGPWEQRPVFKANIKKFVSLRRVTPPIQLSELQQIVKLFPNKGHDFLLDPSFEPERSTEDFSIPKPDPANTVKFSILQKYNRLGLVIPVGAPHMWHAAMQSKSCRLTALGEHYRRLVQRELI